MRSNPQVGLVNFFLEIHVNVGLLYSKSLRAHFKSFYLYTFRVSLNGDIRPFHK